MFSTSVSTILHGVLVTFITLVLTLYLYFKWRYSYWSRRGVNAPLCTFPFGNLADVALGRVSVQEMFKKLYTDLKPKGIKYSGFYFFHKPVLVALDTELIKAILVQDFANFSGHGLFEQKDYDPFSSNLIGLKGEEWKLMREKLSPLFTGGKIKTMFSTIKNCSIGIVDLIDQAAKNSEKLNIQDVASRYTTDVIASVAFGIESNTLKNPNSEFRKYGKRITGSADTASALNLIMQVLMPDIYTFLKIPLYPKDITNFFLKIVQSTVKYREENCVAQNDFMQLMIQLRNNIDVSDKNNDSLSIEGNNSTYKNALNRTDFYSLSIEDIAAQTILFFLAGYESSSITIALCLYELANQQDIQRKLRDEIHTILNKHGELSYRAVMEMTYMEKCIKETLRKYPIVSSLFRTCAKPHKVPNSDLIIEEGMLVMIPVQELHYDPEYYPNPKEFDPERFSSENISKQKTFSWLPFGEGPRKCIGIRLSMIEVKVALIKLLLDFQYKLDSTTVYPLKKAARKMFVTSEEKILLNIERVIN